MATLQAINGIYHIRFRFGGKSFRRSLGVTSSEEAETIKKQAEVTRIDSLLPLQGMAMNGLYCVDTLVTDFSPLKGMPLVTLKAYKTPVNDLFPLKDLPLEYLAVDFADDNAKESIRGIKTLRIINDKPASDFWGE